MDRKPRVFISYSWNDSEGPGHEEWVRGLAEHLTANGITVRLDQWVTKPGESLSAFMEHEVIESDYVVAVCTPSFASRSNDRKGAAGYEQQIVSGEILRGAPRSKFIPILRKGSSKAGPDCAIPTHFLGAVYLDFRKDDQFSQRCEELIRAIFDARKHVAPPTGQPPAYVKQQQAIPATVTPQATAPGSQTVFVKLDHDFLLIGGMKSASRTIDAVRMFLDNKKEVELQIQLEPLQSEIEKYTTLHKRLVEGSIAPLEMEELLSLKDTLMSADVFEDRGNEMFNRLSYFKEALETILTLPKLFKRPYRNADLATIWNCFTQLVSKSYVPPEETTVEVFYETRGMFQIPPGHSTIPVQVSLHTLNSLAGATGSLNEIKLRLGIPLDQIPENIVLERVLPAIVSNFLDMPRWTQAPLSKQAFFGDYSSWKLKKPRV